MSFARPALFLFSICFVASAAGKNDIGEFPCDKAAGLVFHVSRGTCREEDLCKLSVRLLKNGKEIQQQETGYMLFVSGGKIGKDVDGVKGWVIEPKVAPGEDSVGSGNAIVEIVAGEGPSSTKSLLISSTKVGGDLPWGSYDYFVCPEGKLIRAWSGNDSGNNSMATVRLEKGQIHVENGSFSVGQLELSGKSVFQWDPSSKTMKLAKAPKNKPE